MSPLSMPNFSLTGVRICVFMADFAKCAKRKRKKMKKLKQILIARISELSGAIFFKFDM